MSTLQIIDAVNSNAGDHFHLLLLGLCAYMVAPALLMLYLLTCNVPRSPTLEGILTAGKHRFTADPLLAYTPFLRYFVQYCLQPNKGPAAHVAHQRSVLSRSSLDPSRLRTALFLDRTSPRWPSSRVSSTVFATNSTMFNTVRS